MLEHVETVGLHEMFASIIEDADANILFIDEEFKILSMNSGFYWIFFENYGVELRKGSSILDAMEPVNPRLARVWRERCVKALQGTPFKVEETYEIDGRQFHWEVYFKAVQSAEGRMISVFSRDITIRNAYQKRIVENEANLRSILNTIKDGIWLINSRFELLDFNKEFYKTFRQAYGVRLVKGENLLELLPATMPELRDQWRERYEAGLKGRPGKYIESYTVGEEIKTFEIKTYPIVEDGRVTGLTVYSRDITQQKKTEDILTAQNEELTKINNELDRFVYSASHDLRAPLMSVKGLLNMIKVDPDKANTEQYLQHIEKSVNKLDDFISEIIDYSKNSRVEVQIEEIDFKQLLDESISSLKYMEGAEDVRSIITISTPVEFHADRSRVQMIFNNIISNAVRYRDRNKSDAYLEIGIYTNPQKACITFRDNGIGIAPEYLNDIFKMFFRASNDSKGSGLGLYIVKGALEKLKGTIQVDSTLGEGTRFVIELPNLKPNIIL